jgi:hypothetical protein
MNIVVRTDLKDSFDTTNNARCTKISIIIHYSQEQREKQVLTSRDSRFGALDRTMWHSKNVLSASLSQTEKNLSPIVIKLARSHIPCDQLM